jgi:hypothetical protein
MAKPKWKDEIPPDAAPGEYGPITWPEFQALPEDVRQRRIKRVSQKTTALLELLRKESDVDEACDGSRR